MTAASFLCCSPQQALLCTVLVEAPGSLHDDISPALRSTVVLERNVAIRRCERLITVCLRYGRRKRYTGRDEAGEPQRTHLPSGCTGSVASLAVVLSVYCCRRKRNNETHWASHNVLVQPATV